MKGLSVLQPWAAAIMLGVKRIENRTWGAKGVMRVQPQTLAIHTGKSDERITPELRKWFATFVPELTWPLEFTKGALLGTVDVVEVTEFRHRAITLAERHGGVAQGRFADTDSPAYWVLANVRALPRPVPFSGKQGLFEVPDELLREAVGTPGREIAKREDSGTNGSLGLFGTGSYR